VWRSRPQFYEGAAILRAQLSTRNEGRGDKDLIIGAPSAQFNCLAAYRSFYWALRPNSSSLKHEIASLPHFRPTPEPWNRRVYPTIWDINQLRPGRLRGWSSSPGRVKNCNFSISSEPPIQLVPGALSRGVKRQGRDAKQLQLVTRSRKRGSIHPLPHTPSWCSA
jgi:hypothetical protein